MLTVIAFTVSLAEKVSAPKGEPPPRLGTKSPGPTEGLPAPLADQATELVPDERPLRVIRKVKGVGLPFNPSG